MNHLLRVGVAVILLWFAIYGIEQKKDAPPAVDPPAAGLLDKLAPVERVLRKASPVDRALWAEVWEKAAKVVDGDTDREPVFTDTKSLRMFTVLCLDIAWSRIGGNKPGKYQGLREAVEAFLGDESVLGRDEVAATPEIKRAYAEAARALAYAGLNRG